MTFLYFVFGLNDKVARKRENNEMQKTSALATILSGMLMLRNYVAERSGASIGHDKALANIKVVLWHHLKTSIGNYKPFEWVTLMMSSQFTDSM